MNNNPNTQTSASQTARIKAALLRGETLTPMDALRRFGCFRLGARIWDLRNGHGMDIRTVFTECLTKIKYYGQDN